MHKTLRLLVLSMFLMPLSALACATSESERVQLFSQFDTNGDSKISQSEYLAGEESRMGRKFTDTESQELLQHFHDMDKAGAGSITFDQFQPSSLWRDCL